ncbi:hypothetical protein EJD97_001095 [Solanum chilense]|uniref:Integrase zinc-binding domain-containing protein n=1 Tax=Solanum chilense TaxID=4083 RepID=A0A6N2BY32_SOLCI|nr:hypothetical protein EJD97_001095 [Solanum chilense]
MADSPCGDQVPPLEENVVDDHALENPPPMAEGLLVKLQEEYHSAMLHDNMNISRLMVHARRVEVARVKRKDRDAKRERHFCGGSTKKRLEIQDKTRFKKRSGNSPNEKPTCAKCGKSHLGECLLGMGNCIGCGKSGHKVRDFRNMRCQEKGGQASGSTDAPKKNHFYVLHTTSEQETSLDVLTGYYMRWSELLKDYDMNVLYHFDKANMVVDALSRMTMGSVCHIDEAKKDLVRNVHRLPILGVRLESSPNGGVTVHYNSKSSLVVEGDGVLRYQGRLCFLDVDGLRDQILEEAHGSHYSIQLVTKMYDELREIYWWEGMNKDIAEFVAMCPNFHQEIDISICRWWSLLKKIVFIHPFPWLSMKPCMVGGVGLLLYGLKWVNLRSRLQIAYSQQKSYANHRRRYLKFEEGDKVYLKTLPMKGVVRFGKKGKLSPGYVGLYEIFKGKCVKDNLSYEEVPVRILDSQLKRLRNKDVVFVKVL